MGGTEKKPAGKVCFNFMCGPPQAAAGLELHYQAESKGGAPTPPGLLPKQHVQAEVKRLAGLRLKLVNQIRVARSRGGGPAVIPDTELHPLARSTRRQGEANQFFGRRGQHTAPPCWRPSCTQRDTCNAGRECPVFQANATRYGSDTEAFLRAMLAEGPFPPQSRFASLNVLTKQFGCEVPEDYPLPPLPKPRQSINRCVPECAFKHRGCKGGRECRIARAQAEGALIPELAEDFIGPIQAHILYGRAPPPKRPRTFEQQLIYGLELVEGELQRQKQGKAETEEETEDGG